MSSLQWEFSERGGTTVVELSGYLNDASLEQFNGAVGWVLAVGNGPIVLDLGRLQGWSRQGEQAIMKAAARVASRGRSFSVCGGNHTGTRAADGAPWVGVAVFVDLAEAVACLKQPAHQPDEVNDG